MIIKVKEVEYDAKFTFNSFRYLEDFDITALDEVDKKPFRVPFISKQLLMGGLNYTPNKKFTSDEVEQILEDYMENQNIGELLTELVEELQNSNFFKSLQMKTPKVKKK